MCQPNQIFNDYPTTLQVTIRRDCPTIENARTQQDAPLIKEVAQAYDDETIAGWISKQLLAVVKFVGAKEMTDQQVAELAFQLRFDYEHLNLLEFILFCARMRSGRYKEFYGVVDPMAIMKSLDMFCQERFEEHRKIWQEQERIREEKERQEHDANIASPERVQQIIAKYGYDFRAKPRADKPMSAGVKKLSTLLTEKIKGFNNI